MGIFDRISARIKDQTGNLFQGDYNPLADGPLSGRIKDVDPARFKANYNREEKAFKPRFLLDNKMVFPVKVNLYQRGYYLCRREEKRLNNAINTLETFGLYSSKGLDYMLGKYSEEGIAAGRVSEKELKRFASYAGDFSLKDLEIIPGLQGLKLKNDLDEGLTAITSRIEKAQAEIDKERKFLENRTLEIKMKLFALSYALHETGQKLRFAEPVSDVNREWALPAPETWKYDTTFLLKKRDLVSLLEFIDSGLVAPLAASMKANAFLIAVSRERGVVQESIFKMKETMEELNASLQAYECGEGAGLLKSAAKNFLSEKLINRAELFYSSIYGGRKYGADEDKKIGNYMEVYDQKLEKEVIPPLDSKWVETGSAEMSVSWQGLPAGGSLAGWRKEAMRLEAGNKPIRAWREKALTPQEIEGLHIERLYAELKDMVKEKSLRKLLVWFKPQFTESLKEWGLVFEQRYAAICKNPAEFINKYQTDEGMQLEKTTKPGDLFVPIIPDSLVNYNMSGFEGVIFEEKFPPVYTERFVEDVDYRPEVWAKVSGQGVDGIRVAPLNPADELEFLPPTPEELAGAALLETLAKAKVEADRLRELAEEEERMKELFKDMLKTTSPVIEEAKRRWDAGRTAREEASREENDAGLGR